MAQDAWVCEHQPFPSQKQFISIRAMSHPHESSLPQPLPHDAAHFPRHPAPPHLLRGPQGEHPQAPPLHAGPFGRLAIQSPLKGCELKNTWEVISTENTPANATSRRTSFCSTCNSVEEVPTTLSSGDVDDPRMGRLASPPLEQKREASVNPAGVHHSQRENSTSHSPHSSTGQPVARHSHTRENRARTGKVHRKDSPPTKEFELKEEVRDFPKFRKQEAFNGISHEDTSRRAEESINFTGKIRITSAGDEG